MSKLKGQLRIGKWSGEGRPQIEISSDRHIFWIAGVGAPCEDPEIAEAYARLFITAPRLLEGRITRKQFIVPVLATLSKLTLH